MLFVTILKGDASLIFSSQSISSVNLITGYFKTGCLQGGKTTKYSKGRWNTPSCREALSEEDNSSSFIKSPKLTRFTSLIPSSLRVYNQQRLLRVTLREVQLQRGSSWTTWKRYRGQLNSLEEADSSQAAQKRRPGKDVIQHTDLLSNDELRFPDVVSYHLRWGGLQWCSCLWVISFPTSSPSSISL